MTMIGANAAIIDDGRILLIKREDFEVWCLPGGANDPGESLAETAVREAREETGLDVELTRLVGVYSRTGGYMDVHGALFAAVPIGGSLQPQVEEVIDLCYFSLDDLPAPMFWWHRAQIYDAFKGVGGGVARKAELHSPADIGSRQELYAMRDHSGLSRADFYRYFFESGDCRQVLEVGIQDE